MAREVGEGARSLAPERDIHHELALSRSPIGNKQRLIDSDFVIIRDTSDGLGWSSAFVSEQSVMPYRAKLHTGDDILVSMVRRGRLKAKFQFGKSKRIYSSGAGSILIFPDHLTINVELSREI